MNSKRFLALILLLCLVFISFAQAPKSTKYKKEHDFMLTVLYNPTFSLFDFISVGLHERNTKFVDESTYRKSDKIINKCNELYGRFDNNTFHAIYMKVKASWEIFLEVQNTDISYEGMGKYFVEHSRNNIYAPQTQNCPYPELKHKLSIVPLKLEEY